MPSVLDSFTAMQADLAIFVGGLDQKTPTLQLKSGRAIARYAVNYEAAATPGGGYSRVGGYERFNGQARPSDAVYALVQLLSFTNTPTVGQTLTGFTSGATGTILAIGANYLALTLVVGTFTDSEVIKVGATVIGTATTLNVTLSPLLIAQYLNLAADVYRALIGAVPGSGKVYPVSLNTGGVHKVFAFRDNAGASAGAIYQASASGWTAVTLYNEVRFTAGSHATLIPQDGDTLTQGANTALIKRVVHESGSFAAGTAAGRMIVVTPAPGNFGAGAATDGAITFTLSGVQTTIPILPGGRYEFHVHNFGGQLTTKRIYGSDNINRGFEFDGTVYVPIETKATIDVPKHVRVHRGHLLYTIGSSLMISGPGLPYKMNAAAGGAEIAVGDDVTGTLSLPGAQGSPTLLVDCRNSKFILYGSAATGSSPWLLVDFNNETGGVDYSQQVLRDAYSLDDSGVQSLQAAAELSGFAPGSVTFHIQNYITDHRGLLTCSCTHKGKSQYRLYFSSGDGLYLTLVNGQLVGAMPVTFVNPLASVWNAETVSGEERTYAGAASGGFVYELDRGSSFDGANIDATMTLAWNAQKSPRLLKTYRRGSMELSSNFYAAFSIAYRLGYGRDDYSQPSQRNYVANFSGAPLWDGVSWDNFTWDGNLLSPSEIDLSGNGENIEITISSTTDYLYPYTLNSFITLFTPRRGMR
jgi:hypothetical protein